MSGSEAPFFNFPFLFIMSMGIPTGTSFPSEVSKNGMGHRETKATQNVWKYLASAFWRHVPSCSRIKQQGMTMQKKQQIQVKSKQGGRVHCSLHGAYRCEQHLPSSISSSRWCVQKQRMFKFQQIFHLGGTQTSRRDLQGLISSGAFCFISIAQSSSSSFFWL